MRFYIGFFLFFLSFNTEAQPPSGSSATFFAQCMIDVSNVEDIKSLEAEMRLNPRIKVVRIDHISKRVFILTKEINVLTEEDFKSWFMAYASKLRCIQIGVHGVDTVNPYPFKGCEN